MAVSTGRGIDAPPEEAWADRETSARDAARPRTLSTRFHGATETLGLGSAVLGSQVLTGLPLNSSTFPGRAKALSGPLLS